MAAAPVKANASPGLGNGIPGYLSPLPVHRSQATRLPERTVPRLSPQPRRTEAAFTSSKHWFCDEQAKVWSSAQIPPHLHLSQPPPEQPRREGVVDASAPPSLLTGEVHITYK